MHWIWQFLVLHRRITSLTITVFLSLYMISSGKQERQNIARTLTLTVFSPINVVVGGFYQIHNILEENEMLRESIENAQLQNMELRNEIYELTQSADIFDAFASRHEIVRANVVARDPTFFYRTAIINVGANYGIKPNMPVVSNGSVVGKIITVLPLTSQVQMIYEPEEYISIEHFASGAVGILESRTDGTLFANFRSVAAVSVGDTVHTTGLGGIYPRGLKVGVVEKIERPRNGDVFKQIFIRSAINFDGLRRVSVIKTQPQWEAILSEILGEENEYTESKEEEKQ